MLAIAGEHGDSRRSEAVKTWHWLRGSAAATGAIGFNVARCWWRVAGRQGRGRPRRARPRPRILPSKGFRGNAAGVPAPRRARLCAIHPYAWGGTL
ncbi:hypothetical protein LA76x_2790 [Lysobacter antibioticus]|uniref:Uncharacterized protein n=1 Tax=Lysobacter antibioticus TaxID=84531 RepID=A0A0S2FBH8_LYSAN|nr:hypothetical protein LA76x_2790 [Lysobacter antibioticus]